MDRLVFACYDGRMVCFRTTNRATTLALPPTSRGRCLASALFLFCFCVGLTAAAAAIRCAMCGEVVKGKYLKAGNRSYCSRACFRKSLPTCGSCGKPVEGQYLAHEGRRYCSDACFKTILPKCIACRKPLRKCYRINGKPYCKTHAEAPRCEACAMPARPGNVLPDGRQVCRDCFPRLIFERRAADKLYRKAAATVRRFNGRDLPLLPPLHLVGRKELPVHDELPNGVSTAEQGRYVRKTETTTVSVLGVAVREKTAVDKRILILYGLTRALFLSTAAHELMHDIVSEHYAAFDARAPDWAEEGVCQYAAALLCRRLGLKKRLQEIEVAQDPIYGGGYRYMVRVFGEDNWPGVARWMAQQDFEGLPARADQTEQPN